jgi:copper resistance protein C
MIVNFLSERAINLFEMKNNTGEKLKMKLSIHIALLSLAFLSSGLFAHAGLTSSTPKNGEQINISPKHLVLEFNKPVRLLKVELVNSAGIKTTLDFKISAKPSKQFEIMTPALTPGHYKVMWLALGGDSHKMKGSFKFILSEKNATSNSKKSELRLDETNSQ